MITQSQIPLFDLVMCLGSVMDLASPAVADHHERVAYVAHAFAMELGLPASTAADIAIASALHDVGALSLEERLDMLGFEGVSPYHAEVGFQLLQVYNPLSRAATIVRYHHIPWANGRGVECQGVPVPFESHILHLADRIAILMAGQQDVLARASQIVTWVMEQTGRMFAPEAGSAFRSLANKECFWLDATSRSPAALLRPMITTESVELFSEGKGGSAELFRRIIDFRSHFTATHSSGVAATAGALARHSGFSERECRMIRVAGYLHDLGKLAVPTEILDKPGELTQEEVGIFRAHVFHTYHTYRTLQPLAVTSMVNEWASLHHERLDGSGYPFHLKGEELSLGSRIMAVADVFTALTEDRPYRKRMTGEAALQILQHMADDSKLDAELVSRLRSHSDEIDAARQTAQRACEEEYRQITWCPAQ